MLIWEEKQRERWDHTTAIVAAIANAMGGGDGVRPTDLNPFREPETTTFAAIKQDLKVKRNGERVRS